eukprot:10917350-Ditylum_brightwellii.AAC.1
MSNSASQANTSGANIDISITSEVENSEHKDSYTPFITATEMIVTPNNSDAITSSSQGKPFCQQEKAGEEEFKRCLTDLAPSVKSIEEEERGYLSCH